MNNHLGESFSQKPEIIFHHFESLSLSSKRVPFKKRRFNRQPLTEVTVAFSFDAPLWSLFYDLYEKRLNSTEDMTVKVKTGVAVKNPKDMPNRKVARQVATERLMTNPTEIEYSMGSFVVGKKSISVTLSAVIMPKDYTLSRIELVLDKDHGKIRVIAER